jgi:hypothetical protein
MYNNDDKTLRRNDKVSKKENKNEWLRTEINRRQGRRRKMNYGV